MAWRLLLAALVASVVVAGCGDPGQQTADTAAERTKAIKDANKEAEAKNPTPAGEGPDR